MEKMKNNVRVIRGKSEIMEPKTYYITNIVVGSIIGLLCGLAFAILSFYTKDMESPFYITAFVLFVLVIVWNIFLCFPLFRDADTHLLIKILRPILGSTASLSLIILGMYAFFTIIALVACYYLIKFFIHMVLG